MDFRTGKLVAGSAVPERGSSIEVAPLIDKFSTAQSSATASTILDTPREIEGATTLFKSGTIARLESVKRPANALDFRAIQNTPPGDFSARELGLYLTKQEQVAWKHAQWTAQVVDGRVLPVSILQVAITIRSIGVNGRSCRRRLEKSLSIWANRRTVEFLDVPTDLNYVPSRLSMANWAIVRPELAHYQRLGERQ